MVYLITPGSNFIYHILAQIDARKKWGAANIYNKEYVKKQNLKMALPPNVKKVVLKIYAPFSFYPLDIELFSIHKLLEDLKNTNNLNNLLTFFKEPPISDSEKILLYKFLEKSSKRYSDWPIKKNSKHKKRINLMKKNSKIIIDYLNFLDRFNPSQKMPEQINIFLIEALGKRGKGLRNGCAVGLPSNIEEAQQNTIKAMHEMTHQYTDSLLKELQFPTNIRPTDLKNHLRIEDTVNYVLENYLNKNKIFGKEYCFNVNFNLIPKEIKSAFKTIVRKALSSTRC